MELAGLVALYLAGLSFFFTGVAGISENLRLMSGQKFRRLLTRATNHPVLAAALGISMGAITQSSSVVSFILKGMVGSGMLTLRRALLVLACANLGTALLVFAAAVDLHMPVLLLIGFSGLLLASKRWAAWKPGFSALLSVGLLLFGLEMMKQAFHPLSTSSGAGGVEKFLNLFPNSALFAGTLMRTVIHSSSAVAAIAITFSKGGVLGDFPAMMGMAGLGLGAAAAGYLFSRKLKGVPRQISLHQAFTNLGAGLLTATLLSIERFTHIPLLLATLHHLDHSLAGRMAIMYFLFNLAIVAFAIVTLPWAPTWLARIAPPTPEEDLSQPRYLQLEALESPETALDLVELEQMRVFHALELYLQSARGDTGIKLPQLHHAAGQLSAEINAFLEALIKQPIENTLAARILSFQRKEETLRALEENVYLFADALEGRTSISDHTTGLAGRLVEGLDTILLTARDALLSRDATEIDMLIRLTEDRGGMMERLRSRLSLDDQQSVADLSALHYATTLFERNVWLLRQLALWIREDSRILQAESA